MSAAKAKQTRLKDKSKKSEKKKETEKSEEDESPLTPLKIQPNLVVDGKVVKVSYNSGVKERFVHVTEIKLAENENKRKNRWATVPKLPILKVTRFNVEFCGDCLDCATLYIRALPRHLWFRKKI